MTDQATIYLHQLRERWPMWNESQRWPYQRMQAVADMLGAHSWESIKPEMHELERAGKIKLVYSCELNQVVLRDSDDET